MSAPALTSHMLRSGGEWMVSLEAASSSCLPQQDVSPYCSVASLGQTT